MKEFIGTMNCSFEPNWTLFERFWSSFVINVRLRRAVTLGVKPCGNKPYASYSQTNKLELKKKKEERKNFFVLPVWAKMDLRVEAWQNRQLVELSDQEHILNTIQTRMNINENDKKKKNWNLSHILKWNTLLLELLEALFPTYHYVQWCIINKIFVIFVFNLRRRNAIKHFLRLSQQQFLILFNLCFDASSFTKFTII